MLTIGAQSVSIGRSFSRGWTRPPLFFLSLFEQEVSLCERLVCFRTGQPTCSRCVKLNCVELLFLQSDAGLFGQVAHVFRDAEEDAKLVCRLDQFACHADGLRAHVGVDFVVATSLFQGSCSKVVVPGTTGCRDSFCVRIICKDCRSPISFRFFGLQRSRTVPGRAACASYHCSAACMCPQTRTSYIMTMRMMRWRYFSRMHSWPMSPKSRRDAVSSLSAAARR